MSEQKKLNLMQKLAKARVMLQKRNLKKSGQNKFAGFKYFELADFLPAVNEIFDELGLYAEFVIHEPKETTPALATLTIYDSEDTTTFCPRVFKSEIAEAGTKGASPIQQLGSVHTYMRRYLYMEALEIVESDGLDVLNGSDKIAPAEKPKTNYDDLPQILEEFNSVRRDMAANGMPIRDKKVADFICVKANVKSVDPGQLDYDGLKRTVEAMKAILKAKQ